MPPPLSYPRPLKDNWNPYWELMERRRRCIFESTDVLHSAAERKHARRLTCLVENLFRYCKNPPYVRTCPLSDRGHRLRAKLTDTSSVLPKHASQSSYFSKVTTCERGVGCWYVSGSQRPSIIKRRPHDIIGGHIGCWFAAYPSLSRAKVPPRRRRYLLVQRKACFILLHDVSCVAGDLSC